MPITKSCCKSSNGEDKQDGVKDRVTKDGEMDRQEGNKEMNKEGKREKPMAVAGKRIKKKKKNKELTPEEEDDKMEEDNKEENTK
eukprot:14142813-Ditylum_brightwellii.AAC.1